MTPTGVWRGTTVMAAAIWATPQRTHHARFPALVEQLAQLSNVFRCPATA